MPRIPALPIVVALSSLAPSCGGGPPETTVAAAVSLRDALLELQEPPRERDPGPILRFHFAASGVLLQQARQGAPFDAVAFAGVEEMDRLGDLVLPGTRCAVAQNRLVVAIPAGSPAPESLPDLARPEFRRIAIGSPETAPAGRYARQALERAGVWRDLRDRLIIAGDARQVLRYLQQGEVDAGLLYATDAASSGGVEVAFVVDRELHEPIRYVAAALREAPNPDGARRFLELLCGPRGEVVLRRHGFEPPS